MAHTPPPAVRLQWRASTARWRWLLLGTLGVAAGSCCSKATEKAEQDPVAISSKRDGGLIHRAATRPLFGHSSPPTVACGRPFLIDGDVRVAESTTRGDWYPSGALGVAASAAPELDPELRERVAQGWLEQGLAEHASVAAFARFALQLLSVGAPAELVSETSQALTDEVRHACDCFALARRHGGRDVGPAALPLSGALQQLELTEIVLGTIAEGCIGETIAALEAAEAHAHCQDEAARTVLERISADETQHAQLAWRFVAWALEQGPASLRPAVAAAFERELSAAPASSSSTIALSPEEHQLLQQGLVGPELRRALRVRVLHDVVAPCVRALLAPAPAHEHAAADQQVPTPV